MDDAETQRNETSRKTEQRTATIGILTGLLVAGLTAVAVNLVLSLLL